MPEGPEVETVVRTLKKIILNKKIVNIDILYDNFIEYPNKEQFIKNIINQTIKDITRKGKWIIFELDDYYLLSHLRMEGKYFIKDNTRKIEKHEYIIFHLNDNKQLRYQDTRKFGKFHLVLKKDFLDYKIIKELGIDPFSKTFTSSYLKETFKKSNLPIKTLLLDQKKIVGIGNIYANEILFKSNIHPLVKGKDLDNNNLDKIIINTKNILEEAINKGGTTIKSYTSAEGITGLFQHNLLVHGKKTCPTCNIYLLKIKVGGRGTYYCSSCQKETK